MELRAGDLSAGLVPEIGGSLAWFRSRGRNLLRPLSESARAEGNVLGVAMFPMVPYANRIAGNEFTFKGRTYKFLPNNPPERWNVHGTGWHRPWRVQNCCGREAVLELQHLQPEEPYSYQAIQRFRIADNRLEVTTSVRNLGNCPMPFGFGQHPWFERDADVTLEFQAQQFWLEGPDNTATDAITIPPELDFSVARPLPNSWRNNDYGGWSGKALIRFPSRGLGLLIEAEPIFRHLMFYSDPAKPYFCLEPQTNAVCAFNNSGVDVDDLGIIELRPGECAQGVLSIKPFDL